MTKENPKYRTHDSPMFKEPDVDWGPSLTDPSQDIPVASLIDRHLRGGSPAHGLPFGDDLSRVGFTELGVRAAQLRDELDKVESEGKALEAKKLEAAQSKQRELRSKLLSQLKAGSPELQRLASELTRELPGFQADVVAEGDSKA